MAMNPDLSKVRAYLARQPRSRAFARRLDTYETAKGTVRFPLDRPLPVTLIKRLVTARIREVKR